MGNISKKDSVSLGFCPIGKFVFSHEDALRFKRLLEEKMESWNIEFIGIDEIIKDGIVRDVKDVKPVVDFFKRKKVDAIFMPHCNFGTENAVGLIGRDLGVPVVVWAPRDESPLSDGTRLRDSLCGLFASTKVLHKLKVPFTYIENCRIDEKPLENELLNFLSAVNVVKTFKKGIRIGHIGQRIDFFWTTIVNESELLDTFKIEILPIDMVEFISRVKDRASRMDSIYRKELFDVKKLFMIEGFDDDDPLINMLSLRDQMLEEAEVNELDGIALQSFMSIINSLGAYTGLATAFVGNTIPIGMESDIHGTISNIILEKAGLHKDPAYLVDLTIRHPENDNAVLLWHSDAPLDLCHKEVTPRLGHHWILPSPLSGMAHFRLKDGPVTIVRFDGDGGDYKLFIGEGKSIDGPYTLNNYLWVEVNNWLKWERTLMEGPFIHHVGVTYGHYQNALIEACKYIPGLESLVISDVI